MPELIDEHEAARRLGLPVEEVRYRLDYGQMLGTPKGEGWEIDARDVAAFQRGERIGNAIVAARKAHPEMGWVMGNCVVCHEMIAQPTKPHDRWVCSEACLTTAPEGAQLLPDF